MYWYDKFDQFKLHLEITFLYAIVFSNTTEVTCRIEGALTVVLVFLKMIQECTAL